MAIGCLAILIDQCWLQVARLKSSLGKALHYSLSRRQQHVERRAILTPRIASPENVTERVCHKSSADADFAASMRGTPRRADDAFLGGKRWRYRLCDELLCGPPANGPEQPLYDRMLFRPELLKAGSRSHLPIAFGDRHSASA